MPLVRCADLAALPHRGNGCRHDVHGVVRVRPALPSPAANDVRVLPDRLRGIPCCTDRHEGAPDPERAQIQGFYNIPIDNFEAAPLIAKYIKKQNIEDIVVVSPDHGGTTRARKFALNFNAPIAIIDKRRPRPNVAEVMNIIGEVDGKNAIIVDDIVDTAGTVCAASTALKKAGAKDIYVVCTHPVLSGEGSKRVLNSDITKLITTNTIKLSEEKKNEKIIQISVAGLIGQGILNIIDDKPISSLF